MIDKLRRSEKKVRFCPKRSVRHVANLMFVLIGDQLKNSFQLGEDVVDIYNTNTSKTITVIDNNV